MQNKEEETMTMMEILSKESNAVLAAAKENAKEEEQRLETELKKAAEEAHRKKIENLRKEVCGLVKGKQAIGWNSRLYNNGDSEVSAQDAKELSTRGILVLPVEKNNGQKTAYYAVFNLPEIKGGDGFDVRLEVPAGTERLFIGSALWQVKEYAQILRKRHLRVNHIMVVPSDTAV